MKSYIDCIPCFFDQAIRAGRIATNDDAVLKEIVDELGKKLCDISLDSTPPETGRLIYRMVCEITKNDNPYRQIKEQCTQQVLDLYPYLQKIVNEAKDPLLMAIRLAIAGNVIDYGANASFSIDIAIKEVQDKEFAYCDYKNFKKYLHESKRVLYIGDNAGETVFDRLLIEQMQKPTVYVVRGKPIINDATIEDAYQAGLDKVATIVSSGTDAPGTILHTCNEEFKQMMDENDFIIAKGQGNYEALSNEKYPIFFLLKAKCQIIAKDLGVVKGAIILRSVNI